MKLKSGQLFIDNKNFLFQIKYFKNRKIYFNEMCIIDFLNYDEFKYMYQKGILKEIK